MQSASPPPLATATDRGAAETTPHPERPPRRRRWHGAGFLLLFAAAIGFLAKGAWTAQATVSKVQNDRRAAAAAARPADIAVVSITPDACETCYDPTRFVSSFAQNKALNVTTSETVRAQDDRGAVLIARYSIQRLPAFVVTGEVTRLLGKLPQFKSYGQLQDDAFIGVNLPPPYLELSTKVVRGEFAAVYITEKQCAECYDPTVNRQALAQLGMVPKNETTVDRRDADGLALVKKYRLTTTPSLILTGDLAAYQGFDTIWKDNVGTIESDGAYVFRTAQDRMGTYYDLKTKQTVKPKTQDATADSTTKK